MLRHQPPKPPYAASLTFSQSPLNPISKIACRTPTITLVPPSFLSSCCLAASLEVMIEGFQLFLLLVALHLFLHFIFFYFYDMAGWCITSVAPTFAIEATPLFPLIASNYSTNLFYLYLFANLSRIMVSSKIIACFIFCMEFLYLR